MLYHVMIGMYFKFMDFHKAFDLTFQLVVGLFSLVLSSVPRMRLWQVMHANVVEYGVEIQTIFPTPFLESKHSKSVTIDMGRFTSTLYT